MTKKDIKVGSTYVMHHTSGMAQVTILRTVERQGYSGAYGQNTKTLTHWIARNLKTNREIEIKSASKLIGEVKPIQLDPA
jgi:hypothetical protein